MIPKARLRVSALSAVGQARNYLYTKQPTLQPLFPPTIIPTTEAYSKTIASGSLKSRNRAIEWARFDSVSGMSRAWG